MKKTFLMCMGMVLCLLSVLFTGCGEKEKDKVPEDAVAALEASMVYVAGGTFEMGDSSAPFGDRKPVHSVTLSDFYIGKYEVTQSQWAAVMGTTVKQQRDKAGPSKSLYGVGADYPMYYVNWEEANEFCAKLSDLTGKTYRLPTEAEWEYAARGGQKADGTKYAGSDDIDEVAWFRDNSSDMTHPVGQKRPNGLGLYDMSGNVKELCSDWYDGDYYSESPAVNPQGPSSGLCRVRRGGDYCYAVECCCVSDRGSDNYHGDRRFNHIGFRVVCSL